MGLLFCCLTLTVCACSVNPYTMIPSICRRYLYSFFSFLSFFFFLGEQRDTDIIPSGLIIIISDIVVLIVILGADGLKILMPALL